MKTISRPVLFLFTLCMLVYCKKKDNDPPKEQDTPAETQENGQVSMDSREAQSENDLVIKDINEVIADRSQLRGRASGPVAEMGPICGMSVDTTNIAAGTVTLQFNGATCNNRTRTGAVRVTLVDYANGKRWKDAGAVIKVDYLQYKVRRPSDGRSVELNGSQELTNVSGGTWVQLILGQPSLIHTVTGTDLKVTFADNKTATYNINRKFTYTLAGAVVTCKGEGIGSHNGLNNLENYGTTRAGEDFTSQVTIPMEWNTTCGAHAPVNGEVQILVPSRNATLNCRFAVDQAGNPVSVLPNSCAFGWKLSWSVNNAQRSRIFGYN